ncbi:ankyrin repeat-containing protein NPR4-like [Cornus florida]|uniref:ankyrin repeat-containing protein NPR4-like n=1 Tax=Cornus florida TaxID=4283 RepID=UPI00289D8102|nr:ankyrin repeat-containing protein NPR4-like [Cornus florida]
MDERLRAAAYEGNIEYLYALIQEDPNILERNIDDKLVADTPLHVAALTGKHHFAAEVMKLKPSYATKLNPEGLTPIHVALRNGHDRMVEWFISIDSNLVRAKGEEGMTCLHYVILQGNRKLLRSFLIASEESIEDLTTKRETALHIALKFYVPRIFEALVGRLKKVNKEYILNWPDEDGNTILHIATSTNQTEAVKLLLSEKMIRKIKVNAKNNLNLTALDIVQSLPPELNNKEIKDMLGRAKFMLCWPRAKRGEFVNDDPLEDIDKLSMQEKIEKYYFGFGDRDMSQAVLTVAVLIATAAFQAVLSPPGGLWEDYHIPTEKEYWFHPPLHIAGTSTMLWQQYFVFYFLNSVTFYAAMSIIHLHTKNLILLNMTQIFLCATYCCSLVVMSPIVSYSKRLNVIYDVIIVLTQLFFFVCAFPDISHLEGCSILLAEIIVLQDPTDYSVVAGLKDPEMQRKYRAAHIHCSGKFQ